MQYQGIEWTGGIDAAAQTLSVTEEECVSLNENDLPRERKRKRPARKQAGDTPSIIIGRYEILSTLGKGGMGTVFKAEDNRLDRLVAVKTILPDRLRREEASRRFSREARVLARLNHPAFLLSRISH